jgi:tripartite ATP-independent transporter DctM subunit
LQWFEVLALLFGLLVILLLTGLPVAYVFIVINIVGIIIVFGGAHALALVVPSAYDSVASFNLAPILFFLLMGELLTRPGLATLAIEAVDKWIGRLPGRLSLVAVGGGTFFAALSGSSIASTAMLGSSLGPEMERRGYKPQMSIGPILAGASLDPLIPPSALAVLLGVLANVSIGKLLIAGAGPGFFLAGLFMLYFLVRAKLQPQLAPPYDAPISPLSERLLALWHLVPLAGLIFIVTGLIFVGVATPTEAAALGAAATAVLVAAYRKLSPKLLLESARATMVTTATVLFIIVGSKAYSQLLAATGASRSLVQWAIGLPVEPIMVVFGLIMIVIVLGFFIDAISIMLITVPLYMPVVTALGFDPLWFALLMLIGLELGGITPPFGVQLFVIKAVMPHIPMGQIWQCVWPQVLMQFICILVFMAYPSLTYVFLQFIK